MIISAINAMTMTPARAAWIFANRERVAGGGWRVAGGGWRVAGGGRRKVFTRHPPPATRKEALPWWSFALFRLAGDRVAADADPGRRAGPAGGGGRRGAGARRPESHPAGVGVYPRPLPPRRGRRGGARLVPDPAGELDLGASLPPGFNWVFDGATRAYGKTVGWCLRLSDDRAAGPTSA